jgi:hypothetical protein
MIPNTGQDPVIIWYYANLEWLETPLGQAGVRIDVSTPNQRISRTLPLKQKASTSNVDTITRSAEIDVTKSNRIFMSYRSTEREFAQKLALDLRRRGVRVWMDVLGGIPAGADWEKTLQEAIDSDGTVGMIAILSPDYVASRNCLRELRRADRANPPKFIVPVLFKEISFEQMPMNIQDLQYVDFTKLANEDQYKTRVSELFDRLKEKLEPT